MLAWYGGAYERTGGTLTDKLTGDTIRHFRFFVVDECGRYKNYLASIKIPSSTNSGGARSHFLLPCFVKCFGQNDN